jgi:hypothetical protein
MTVFHSRRQAEPCARTRSIVLADDVALLQRWLGAALATLAKQRTDRAE